ncbi:MAG: cation-translocating P-type ATPase, partial [Verrucomicrobia bacterium]|nr:cation-translocating P-type ATPase [Verrucomicrobiota bacterium]
MNCGNCARKVTAATQTIAGVRSVDINLEDQVATLQWSVPSPDVEGVVAAIEAAGYKVEVLANAPGEDEGQAGWHMGLWVGVGCTTPMLIGEWIFHLGGEPWFKWLSFALASVVQVVAGARFYQGAWLQLKARSSNMDTLVAIGSTTAFAYSVWALLAGWPGHVFFMEAAAIITVVSVGHWMEARVTSRAAGALQALLSLTPATARRRTEDGSEEIVPVSALRRGDTLVLKPGDAVPTDGRIAGGSSSVDESMLTGESLPVEKSAGKELYAGTTVQDGQLVVEVTATGEATALANIIAAVRRAQSSSANIQRLGDRVSSVFVPVVLAVALAAGLWWALAYDHARATHDWLAGFLWSMPAPTSAVAAGFIIAAAVLIIACPCAMGLATPTAIMAAANVAARRGILIRDGVALEKAGAITVVMFDKTGTLTTGKPVVVASHFPGPAGHEDASLKQLAAALARHSLHPYSQAVATLNTADVELKEWRELRGAGVLAKVRRDGKDQTVRLGSLRWVQKESPADQEGRAFVDLWTGQGASVIGLSLDFKLLALFAVKDELKSGAIEVVRRLENAGVQVHLVTGDQRRTAASIGQQVGITPGRIHAEVRPEGKAELVKQLQEAGERVAFVGDGINDAPALEQASLGVAVCRASDIAREAADIVLLSSDIEAVPESLFL